MSITVVFAGTSAFGIPSLRALAADKRFTIPLVITQPDRPVGRKQELTASPIKTLALELGLPLWQPENINAEWESNPLLATQNPSPDFLVVIAYGQLLKRPVLDWATQMPLNVHGSLLPRWRGASPVHHAVLSGDRESGVTVQRMVAALDAGPVLTRASTPLSPRETFRTLHDRLAAMSPAPLLEALTTSPTPRDQDESEVTVCRKLAREDGKCDPGRQTAEEIDRRVRALTPWPGVTMPVDGTELKILETALEPTTGSFPVSCADWTILHMTKVQTPGGKPISGEEWRRGAAAKGKNGKNE